MLLKPFRGSKHWFEFKIGESMTRIIAADVMLVMMHLCCRDRNTQKNLMGRILVSGHHLWVSLNSFADRRPVQFPSACVQKLINSLLIEILALKCDLRKYKSCVCLWISESL